MDTDGTAAPAGRGQVWAAAGLLDGLFPTCLRQAGDVYHLDRLFQTRSTTYIPVGAPSRRIQDFLSINEGRDKSRTDLPARGRQVQVSLKIIAFSACNPLDCDILCVFRCGVEQSGSSSGS